MVTSDHLCPWGIKAWDLLKRNGFDVDDRHIESMDANKQYKEEHGVDKTPQIYIEDKHIGDYEQLREHLGPGSGPKEGETYRPIIAIFAITFGMAVSTSWAFLSRFDFIRIAELFIAFSVCAFGIQKLIDLHSCANGFVQYDLLAQRYVPYASVYAYIETLGGVLIIAGILTWVVAPVVLAATTLGAVSIIKTVYIEKRDLKCASVGGCNDVPLGFISLTENHMMMAMAVRMTVKSAI